TGGGKSLPRIQRRVGRLGQPLLVTDLSGGGAEKRVRHALTPEEFAGGDEPFFRRGFSRTTLGSGKFSGRRGPAEASRTVHRVRGTDRETGERGQSFRRRKVRRLRVALFFRPLRRQGERAAERGGRQGK